MCPDRNDKKDNVVAFPRRRRTRYAIDVISESTVNGMVLIEACIPLTALQALMRMLEAS